MISTDLQRWAWGGRSPHRPLARAFTLVEMLVVMAITVILLGLIFGPMVETFNLTARARVQVQVQDYARQVMEQVQRELSDGAFVVDNAGMSINAWVPDPTRQRAGGAWPVLVQPLPYGWLDLVPPGRVNDQNSNLGAGIPIDPTTGLPVEDQRGPLALPVAPGRVMSRYFVGLSDNATQADSEYGTSGRPVRPYINFYDNPATGTIFLADHNPFILYRAVFSPYTIHGRVDTRLLNLGRFGSLDRALRDPNFFYDNDVAVASGDPATPGAAVPGWRDLNGDGRVNYSENWRAIARPLVPARAADMVSVVRDNSKNPVYYVDGGTGNLTMKATALARFQPTFVGNDPGVPTSSRDTGDESPWVAPSSYVESYGHWTDPFRAYVFRGRLTDPILTYFFWSGSGNVRYTVFDTNSGLITNGGGAGEDTGFDPKNPTSLPAVITPDRFLMFSVDARRGIVNFAFPHTITQGGASEPSRWLVSQANDEFNHVRGLPGYELNAYRYVTLLPGGAANPAGLLPGMNPSDPNPAFARIPYVQIVPGSEVVTGPDRRPGVTYGQPIAYTRAPRNTDPRRLGPNEYVINYTNRDNANLNAVDPDPRAQAMLRAIQRSGTIIFDSQDDVPGEPHALPAVQDGNGDPVPVTITYQIQNNRREAGWQDVVKADYLTRQLMTFALSVRLYEARSGAPQTATLTQKIRVRNLQR